MRKQRKTSRVKASAIDLEISPTDQGGFGVTLHRKLLLTGNGTPLIHPATPLLEHIVTEFDGHGHVMVDNQRIVAPQFFGAFALFSLQKEWIELGKDDLAVAFEEKCLNDPVLHTVAGPEQVDQLARWEPLNRWLGENVQKLRGHAEYIRYYGTAESDDADYPEDPLDREEAAEILAKVRDSYHALSPEQKSVVMYLHAIHRGHVLFPLGLVLEKCNVMEYALAVMAGEAILSGIFGDVNDKDHRRAFENLRTDARTALEYIRYYREGMPSQRLTEMIALGESARQEFKATLRWNLRSERNDDAVTYACVKTVAAFLNSEGGRLLIGVADDGGIVGIERDGFDNFDKFQLRLMDTLKHHLGEAAAADVAVEVIQAAGAGTVCLVNCSKSSTPVYCQLKNGEEHFYVRTGPGTTQLPPREMVTYLTNHFHVGTTPPQ
jgi:hypothetical protein